MHSWQGGGVGLVLGAVVGESFRLTTGTLSIITLIFGLATAVAVAVINTRGGRGLDHHGDGKDPLEAWAIGKLDAMERENRELEDRCSRQAMELASTQEELRNLRAEHARCGTTST